MNLDQVAAILERVVASVVMPSFRSLRPEDILTKDTPGDPDDLVTIVDQAAERSLVEQLSGIVPGAAFIGEEAVSENPALLSRLSSSPFAWLIDPIDGTKNFARGIADFGVMLALVENGATRASWMAVPAARPDGYLVTAEAGRGTQINGTPVRTTPPLPGSALRGTVHTRMMPPDRAREVDESVRGRCDLRASTGSAATEYSAIVLGEKDFVVYYRLLPWDHAPGTLAVTEAGGVAMHLNGNAYSPLSTNQLTILAATAEVAETVRGWLSRGQYVSVSR